MTDRVFIFLLIFMGVFAGLMATGVSAKLEIVDKYETTIGGNSVTKIYLKTSDGNIRSGFMLTCNARSYTIGDSLQPIDLDTAQYFY